MATFYIQLENKLLQISGELTAENISKALGYVPVDSSTMNNYATKDEVSDLVDMSMVEELSQRVDNITFDNLKDNPFLQDGSGELNIVDEAGNIIAKIDANGIHSVDFIAGNHKLTDKIDSSALNGYAKESWVTAEITKAATEGKVDLTGYATEEWVENKNYLTEHQDISHLATKEEVSNIDFYNINNNPIVNNGDGKLLFVDENGYIGLQLEEDGLYVKDVIADGHTLSQKADKSDIPSLDGYATESYVNTNLQNYATKDEVSDLVDMSVVTELQGKVNTLIDTDADKSVRDIAVDVLTETLVSETATEAYDTLAEMSAWIKSHPEDASAMNTAIQKNATDITNLDVAYKAADAKVLIDAQEYTDNINFYTIKDNPIVDNNDGNLTFVDESGNIGLQFSNNAILVNDVITPEHTLSSKADKSELPTKTSDLTNDSGFITINDVPAGSLLKTYTFLGNNQDHLEYTITQEELEKIQNADIVYFFDGTNNIQLTVKNDNNGDISFHGYYLSSYPDNVKIYNITISQTLDVIMSLDSISLSDYISDYISGSTGDAQSSYIVVACEEIVDGASIEIVENQEELSNIAKPISLLLVDSYGDEVLLIGPYAHITTDGVNLVKFIGEYNNLTIECVLDYATMLHYGTLHIKPKSEVDLSDYYNKSEIDTKVNNKQDTLVSGTNIKTINGKSILGEGDIKDVIEVTYLDLKSLVNDNKLVPGCNYRITNYTCTTTEENTKSANHQFDIIITANDESTLSHLAKAISHDGDNYFENCHLSAWQLWYDLNNDTSKYAWADEENGTGVIYRMIDEYNNDCPYDFKNIMFRTDKYNDLINVSENTYFYTFSVYTESSEQIIDQSIKPQHTPHNNLMSVYRTGYNKQYLNKNIICTDDGGVYPHGNKFDNNCSNNIIFGELTDNTFGYACSYNTIAGSFRDNKLGYTCCYNTIGYNCHHNNFGEYCSYNTIGNECNSNTIKNRCSHNTIGNKCSYNIIGNKCSYNTIGNECNYNIFEDFVSDKEDADGNYIYSSNTLGNYCNNNIFGIDCYNNTLGNSCNYNTFEKECFENVFGYACNYNTLKTKCKHNTLTEDCSNNIFGNGCTWNNLGSYCNENTFGRNCAVNVLGEECNYNKFEDYCTENTLVRDCRFNILKSGCGLNNFEEGCSYITLNADCSNNNVLKYSKNVKLGNNCEFIKLISSAGEISWNNYIKNVIISNNIKGTSSNVLNIEINDSDENNTLIIKNVNNNLIRYFENDVINKQDKLISGSNIKTINGESILGDGDIIIDTTPPHIKAVCSDFVEGAQVEIVENGELLQLALEVPVNFVLVLQSSDLNKCALLSGPYASVLILEELFIFKFVGLFNDLIIELVLDFNGLSSGILHIKSKNEDLSKYATKEDLNYKGNVQAVDTSETLDDVETNIGSVNSHKKITRFTGNNVLLLPNIYYVKTDTTSDLTITLDTSSNDNDIMNEYFIKFTTAENGTTVSLPNTIKWAENQVPVFENNCIYHISVVDDLGVCVKFV